ncbi:MAG: bifunctional folylpolyglutamate synthase/dihydrofolate synthase [Chloroflexi bacterium]|nr:bifunctional folylpolyglutamate synthase/dihydrofolate synthase [Chloroflexota bacterium]
MTRFTYNDALNTLYGFINYELKRQDQLPPEALNLDRPRQLAAIMGNPENRYPIIHVAGTKGKGSVCAMCVAMLQAAGYKVGLYTSPHMQDFRERFQINGQLISQEQLAQIVFDLKPIFAQVEGLSWFEATTALAFEYFAREKVDIAVIEVGLGGTLDSTNIVKPIVSIITSLSFDHMAVLGNTIGAIAGEKAGIIKSGIPVVSAPQPADGQAVIERVAAEKHAPLTLIGRDWLLEIAAPSLDGQRFSVQVGDETKSYTTNLLGQHQAINAAVALAAMPHVEKAGLPVPASAQAEGLQNVRWAGRLEIVHHNPLVVTDAAHNRASARYLAESLTQLFTAKPLVLVFGAKGDKDISGMMEELLPMVDSLVITQAVDARAENPDQIVAKARQVRPDLDIAIVSTVGDALRQGMRLAEPQGLVCATGSLYIVGEVRTELGIGPGEFEPTAANPSHSHTPIQEQ